MKFTITILGCGPSLGVPIPTCTCPTCSSTNPKNRRLRTSALIETESGVNILIDASPDIREQVLRFNITQIDAVVMTHEHADHTLGLDYLRIFNFIQKKSIPVYGSPRVLNALKEQFTYIFYPDPNYVGGGLPKLIPQEIDEMTPFMVEGIKIQPFRMLHGKIRATGFRIGSVAYATDCHEIPEGSRQVLMDCEHLIVDGLSYKKHSTHFNVDEAVALSQDVRAKNTYITHMTHYIEIEKLEENTPDSVYGCYDGMKLEGTLL